MIKVEGLGRTWKAVRTLGNGEHLWLRGIGDVLILVRRMSDSAFMMGIYSVERIARRFAVKNPLIKGRVRSREVVKLIEKLSARPCHVVNSGLVEVDDPLDDMVGQEIGFSEFIEMARGSGIQVQASP